MVWRRRSFPPRGPGVSGGGHSPTLGWTPASHARLRDSKACFSLGLCQPVLASGVESQIRILKGSKNPKE